MPTERMVELPIGTVIHLNSGALKGMAAEDLKNVPTVIIVSRGDDASNRGADWSVVKKAEGQQVRVLNADIEPAITQVEKPGNWTLDDSEYGGEG